MLLVWLRNLVLRSQKNAFMVLVTGFLELAFVGVWGSRGKLHNNKRTVLHTHHTHTHTHTHTHNYVINPVKDGAIAGMRKECTSIHNFNTNKWGNEQYNATLRKDRVTTAAVKKKYYTFWVCVCNLSYSTRNAHVPYYILTRNLSSCTILYTWVRASWIEFNDCPTRSDLFSLLHFWRQLYMFRVLTPIIRSWYSCNYSFWYWLTGSTTIRSRCWVGNDSCVS